MMIRRTSILAVFAAALFTLSLSSVASAQSNDPWWGRNDSQQDRDRRERERQRREDDDYYNRNGNNRNDGSYGRNNSGNYGRYDEREVRDVAQRLKDRSHNLERDVDRFLDNSRVNGTRREDHINSDIQEFRHAADNFRSRIGNGRDLNRSVNEAQQLLSSGEHAEQMLSRLRVDSRTYADWSKIDQDLRFVANIYGLRYNGGYNNNRGTYDPRYPNDNRSNNGWWRRVPDIINGRRP